MAILEFRWARIARAALIVALFVFTRVAVHAAVSEIRKDFLNNTSLLPASPIVAAPSADASYMICVTAGNIQNTAPTAILRWTDENSQYRNFAYPTVNGIPSGCNLIRNQPGTAPTIETDGSYIGPYNLFVFGLGFWPGGDQAQGGLTESLNYISAGVNGGQAFSFPGFPWLFTVIAASNCKWQLSAGSVGILSGSGSTVLTSYGTGSGVFTTLTTGCRYSVIALQFSTPKLGAGPLTDYEYNLLDWRDATYPKLETIFTTGSKGANILFATNIAEQPNNGIVSEQFTASWNNETTILCAASLLGEPSGEPSSCVSPAFIAPLSSLQISTYNTPGQKWGTSPTYSAEVDVIQF